MKPVIGQIVFGLNVGNAAIRREQKLTKMIVTSVGHKYFKARKIDDEVGFSETQFHNDNWFQKTEHCADIALYETEQSYLDEKETSEICVKLWKFFEYGMNTKRVSLKNLREMLKLAEEGAND